MSGIPLAFNKPPRARIRSILETLDIRPDETYKNQPQETVAKTFIISLGACERNEMGMTPELLNIGAFAFRALAMARMDVRWGLADPSLMCEAFGYTLLSREANRLSTQGRNATPAEMRKLTRFARSVT